MNEKIGMIIFFTVFFLIYASLNYFVITSYAKLLKINKAPLLYGVILLMSISFIVASMLTSNYANIFTRSIYIISAIWMGFLFISLCLLILFNLVNLIIPITTKTFGAIILSIAILISAYAVYNAHDLKTNTIIIESSKLDKDYTLVQVTDMHIGPIHSSGLVNRVSKKINEINPDVVLNTGDLFDGRYKYTQELFDGFKTIKAPHYYVIGNHETYAGTSVYGPIIKNTPLKIINDNKVEFQGLTIIGINDNNDRLHVPKVLPQIISETELKNDKFKILLYHRPNGYRDAAYLGINLMLSGHTHAGQIWPFGYLSAMANDALVGNYNVENNKEFTLHINSGTGTWGPPMRIGSSAEITIIKLVKIK